MSFVRNTTATIRADIDKNNTDDVSSIGLLIARQWDRIPTTWQDTIKMTTFAINTLGAGGMYYLSASTLVIGLGV
jgi:hypothetical protein